MLRNITIWDSSDTPSKSLKGTVLLWRNYGELKQSNVISIPKLIEENAEELRQLYLALVYEIGEVRINGMSLIDRLELHPGFSYWWMTLIIQKCNYSKSSQITDVIRYLAFDMWAKQMSINSINIISANRPLILCIQTWCKEKGIVFERQMLEMPAVSKSILWHIFGLLPIPIQTTIWLLKYFSDRYPLRRLGLKEWRQTQGKITFISYLFNLVPEATSSGCFESNYWTRLPDVLAVDDRHTNWLHLIVKDSLLSNAKKAAEVISNFNKNKDSKQVHVTLDTFLGVNVLYSTIRDWLKLYYVCKNIKSKIANDPTVLSLWPLIENDWVQSINSTVSISNLLNLNLFKSAFAHLPIQKNGLYLQENQGWETGLIHSWRVADQGRLIGVPHSTVRYWDLRYFFDPRSYKQKKNNPLPMPDLVACNGPLTLNVYRNSGYPNDKLVEVEALRYLHINNLDFSRNLSTEKTVGYRILVFGDYLAKNTYMQLRLLEQTIPLIPDGIKITFKKHPACTVNLKDFHNLNMTASNENISELLTECDAVYSSAVTSAAVDAYCSGKLVITMIDGSDLNLSPLRGYEGVMFVSTPEEFAIAIKNIGGAKQIKVKGSDFFYLDPKLSKWTFLLKDQNKPRYMDYRE
jgi:surface carbohydrate biosynthesis protein (TIGR04326 family)